MRIAYFGLGTMGGAMAGHIRASGRDLRLFNRSRPRAEAWGAQHGGTVMPTIADAAQGADIAFTCLSDDRATAEIVTGSGGLIEMMAPGSLVVDHGSGSPAFARELAERLAARGIDFFDAPVTGGSRAAHEGTLTIMAGARPDKLAIAEPVMRCYATDIVSMGDVGAGHQTKLVNVVIGQGTSLAVAEGLGFAMAAGLDPAKVTEVLLKGSSRSWLLEHRSAAMIARDFQPLYPMTMAGKDLDNVLAEARECCAPLPLTAMIRQFVMMLANRHGADQDLAAIIRLYTEAQHA